ncbi:MAG: glycosyltransferase family 2 protein [Nitrospirota bacterium]|nr:glycosyltransferase family 2 protein [Nitrospirota bacterium]
MEYTFWIIISLIVYTILGYALVLWLIASLFYREEKKSKQDPDFLPQVTLLIPAYNEDKVISDKILNSLALDYPKKKLRIIIASDGSTDKTNTIVSSYQAEGVLLWSNPQRCGKISVINQAMHQIHDGIVVLSDANVMYDKQAIQTLVQHFKDPEVGVVSGNVSLIKTNSPVGALDLIYQAYENQIKALESKTGSVTGADGAMYAIRREDYQTVAKHVILDDLVISMNILKKGKRILFESKAKGKENSVSGVKEAFWTRVRVVAGGIQAIKTGLGMPPWKQGMQLFQFISHKILRWLLPLQFLGLFIINGFLLEQTLYMVLFAIQLSVYSMALLAHFIGNPVSILSAPYYFGIQNIAAMLGIWRGLSNSQSVKWDKGERYFKNGHGNDISEKHLK